MKLENREQIIYSVAVVAAVLAAVGALFTSGDLELTLVMAGAVVAGLVCFDTSMEHRLQSFAPWLLLSLAPAFKTVPMVWQQLRVDSGASFERYDHAGSLLFGLCVMGAVVLLSRPSTELGSTTAAFDAAVVAGTAITAALAGASVAFLFDSDFGSATAGRVLETPTWFVIGGVLAAATIAASRVSQLSAALTGLLSSAAASAGLLAFLVAGGDVDRGWWAALFAAFTISAAVTGGALGQRDTRDRLSNVSVAIAIVAGVVAAAAAITARSDRDAWGPGWALLGIMSLVLFGLAMASRPLDEQRLAQAERSPRPQDIGIDQSERAARAKARALSALAISSEPDVGLGQVPLSAASAPDAAEPAAIPAAAQPQHQTAPPKVPPGSPAPGSPASASPGPAPLSDANIVASARDAAAVRTAPSAQRHSLAPLAQAHHFDPSTGLLSASGLQHAIARAFDVPRRAGHVTIMMFMIRDLDRIERNHGRLASAAVTREVADRVNKLLPDGSGARFARSAYAIVFVGDMSNANETVQRLARVLLQLRAPVEGGSLGDKIDVVAGMAQCYEREDAAQFVTRANQGLARAVQTPEPTFVAMP